MLALTGGQRAHHAIGGEGSDQHGSIDHTGQGGDVDRLAEHPSQIVDSATTVQEAKATIMAALRARPPDVVRRLVQVAWA